MAEQWLLIFKADCAVRPNCSCWFIFDLTEKPNKTIWCRIIECIPICRRFYVNLHTRGIYVQRWKTVETKQGPIVFKKTDVKHFTDKLSYALFVCKKTANSTIPHDSPPLGTSYAVARNGLSPWNRSNEKQNCCVSILVIFPSKVLS